MADSYAFKIHVFELLRDQQQWTAFSQNAEAAQRVAKGWGVDLTRERAGILLEVLTRLQEQLAQATADFLNAAFEDATAKINTLLMVEGPRSSPISLATAGLRGGGGGPHHPWEFVIHIDASGMMALSSVRDIG